MTTYSQSRKDFRSSSGGETGLPAAPCANAGAGCPLASRSPAAAIGGCIEPARAAATRQPERSHERAEHGKSGECRHWRLDHHRTFCSAAGTFTPGASLAGGRGRKTPGAGAVSFARQSQ